ncbi:uncharacterized protein [Littorina saxatilis]
MQHGPVQWDVWCKETSGGRPGSTSYNNIQHGLNTVAVTASSSDLMTGRRPIMETSLEFRNTVLLEVCGDILVAFLVDRNYQFLFGNARIRG